MITPPTPFSLKSRSCTGFKVSLPQWHIFIFFFGCHYKFVIDMPKPQQYKFCFGPWNISEGQDPYGPTTRPAQSFDWKLDALKKLGYDAMMFHDDDAVPDIDGKSDAELKKAAKELKKKLDDAGIAAEMVAPTVVVQPNDCGWCIH